MNRSNKNKQHKATGSNRPVSVKLLSSEEELSDRRSSSSIESSQSHKDSKCQRSTRKATKKSWNEKLIPFDCQYVISSTSDEEGIAIPDHSSDSDLDWSPKKSQSRSTVPPKLTSIAMKRAGSPPILQSEKNFNASEKEQHSSPPKLMAIINKSKKGCSKPIPRPPQLKAKPVPNINKKDKILLSVQTNPQCMEITSRRNCSPPILEAKPILEKNEENKLSAANCRPPKLKVKPAQPQNRGSNQVNPNLPLSDVLVEHGSPNSREKLEASVTSPGPPNLSPIFVKEKDRDVFFDSPLKETTIPMLIENDVSESSLEPPNLTIIKKKGKRGSHKSSEPPPIIKEIVPFSEVTEKEDYVSTSSPGPPNIVTKSKKRFQNSSHPSFLEESIFTSVRKKDQQISVPSLAAPNLESSIQKSQLPILEKTKSISVNFEELEPSLIHLKPKLISIVKVKRNGSKSSRPLTEEDVAPISVLPELEDSTTLRPTQSKVKTSIRKTKSSPKSSLPTVKLELISDGVQRSTTPSPMLCIDFSLSFSGIISQKASLLEKWFESGKFIMLKSDLKTQKSPSIWRIDGKNLLQKYESISYNEGTAYRNISTYSSWMASNKGLYVPIEVEFSVQSKSETIVTFDRSKVLLPIEDRMMEALNEEANSMIDTFQIYLQTLISQALDSNFVKEIVNEHDEYFLTSIAAIEDHWILPKRNMLKEIIKIKKPFQELLETHPGLELRCVTSGDKSCDCCNGRNPTRSFEFQTLSYRFDTLDIMEGKPSNKIYRLCLSCTDKILLYHELFHMRYHLFTCCQTKVNQYDQGDGPAALTSSLADQSWKSLMHRKVLLVLAETQQVVSQYSVDASV